MQVSSIRTGNTSALSQREQFIAEMYNALQSGNIIGAQEALAKLRSESQWRDSDPAPAPAAAPSDSGPVVTKTNVDFAAMLSSVDSGDLSGAQAAWQKVRAAAASHEH